MSLCSSLGEAALEPWAEELTPNLSIIKVHFLLWNWYPIYGLLPGTPPLFFFFFEGLQPWRMEVPRLGVELELQQQAYTTATATWDPSCVCELHHSSQQCWVLSPLSEARH